MTAVRATDLLIAPPAMPDPRFRDSVLMLTHHETQGSFALCVNRVTEYTLVDVLDHSNISVDSAPRVPVYWGGPVSAQSLWMIHSAEWHCEGTVMITNLWAMTSSEEMFHCLAVGDVPQQFRIVMGYAAWSPGQLAAELIGQGPWRPEHSWLVAQNLGPEWLFEQPVEDLWANVVTLSSHQAVDTWL